MSTAARPRRGFHGVGGRVQLSVSSEPRLREPRRDSPRRRAILPRDGGPPPSPRLGVAHFVRLRAPGAGPGRPGAHVRGGFSLPSELPTVVPMQERRGHRVARRSCRLRSVPPAEGLLLKKTSMEDFPTPSSDGTGPARHRAVPKPALSLLTLLLTWPSFPGSPGIKDSYQPSLRI